MKDQLSPAALATWDTAVQYHLLHALALVLTGVLGERHPRRAVTVAGIAFVVGIILFSGSLYLLAFGAPRMLGPLTPLGGVAFVAGWLALATAALDKQSP